MAVIFAVLLLPPLIAALISYWLVTRLRKNKARMLAILGLGFIALLGFGWYSLRGDPSSGGYGPEFAALIYLIYVAGPVALATAFGALIGWRRR